MVEILYILLAITAAGAIIHELLRLAASRNIPFYLKLSMFIWLVTVVFFGVDSFYKFYGNIYNVALFDNVIVWSTLLSMFFTLVGGWQYAKIRNDCKLKSLILQKGIPFLVVLLILRIGLYLR